MEIFSEAEIPRQTVALPLNWQNFVVQYLISQDIPTIFDHASEILSQLQFSSRWLCQVCPAPQRPGATSTSLISSIKTRFAGGPEFTTSILWSTTTTTIATLHANTSPYYSAGIFACSQVFPNTNSSEVDRTCFIFNAIVVPNAMDLKIPTWGCGVSVGVMKLVHQGYTWLWAFNKIAHRKENCLRICTLVDLDAGLEQKHLGNELLMFTVPVMKSHLSQRKNDGLHLSGGSWVSKVWS